MAKQYTQEQLAQIDQQLQLLLEQVAVLNRNRFGRASERMDDSQQHRTSRRLHFFPNKKQKPIMRSQENA